MTSSCITCAITGVMWVRVLLRLCSMYIHTHVCMHTRTHRHTHTLMCPQYHGHVKPPPGAAPLTVTLSGSSVKAPRISIKSGLIPSSSHVSLIAALIGFSPSSQSPPGKLLEVCGNCDVTHHLHVIYACALPYIESCTVHRHPNPSLTPLVH